MTDKYGNKNEIINITYTEVINDVLPWKPTCTRCGYCVDFVWNLKYKDSYVEQVCDDCILEEEIEDMKNVLLISKLETHFY